MAIILFIAFSNFIYINCSVQKTEKQTKDVINKIDSINMFSPSINEEWYKDANIYLNGIKESMRELERLKKNIFDNNTITFISSFALVFLGGILFDIEKRTKDKLAKFKELEEKIKGELNQKLAQSKELIEKIEVELNQIRIAKQINTMTILSKYLQLQLSSNNYLINEDTNNIANELIKSFQNFQSLIQDNKTKYITKDAQNEYKSVFNEIEFLLKKEDITDCDENNGKLNYIFESQKQLSACKKAIDSMENSGRIISGLP